MAFQYRCPDGHLLEGDPSQAGQKIRCPVCQQAFIVPQAAEEETPVFAPQIGPASDFAPQANYQEAMAPAGGGGLDVGGGGAAQGEPQLLHIPCPSCKRPLETPTDMLNQDVLCPHCSNQFHLLQKNSIEAIRQKKEEIALQEYRSGKKWLSWAIAFGILVLLFLAILIGITIAS